MCLWSQSCPSPQYVLGNDYFKVLLCMVPDRLVILNERVFLLALFNINRAVVMLSNWGKFHVGNRLDTLPANTQNQIPCRGKFKTQYFLTINSNTRVWDCLHVNTHNCTPSSIFWWDIHRGRKLFYIPNTWWVKESCQFGEPLDELYY